MSTALMHLVPSTRYPPLETDRRANGAVLGATVRARKALTAKRLW